MSDELVRDDSPWRRARPAAYAGALHPKMEAAAIPEANERPNLIAPLTQTMHSSLVYARKHERPHGILVLPNGSRPESIPSIAKNRDSETAYF
jgi:hypothetical protein